MPLHVAPPSVVAPHAAQATPQILLAHAVPLHTQAPLAHVPSIEHVVPFGFFVWQCDPSVQ